MTTIPFLANGQTLSDFYDQQIHNHRKQQSGKEVFFSYTNETLVHPGEWFKALALLEYLLETEGTNKELVTFCKFIFNGFDSHASVDLNDEDYCFFWDKIHQVLDRMGNYEPDILLEKSFLYFNPRKEYQDWSKVMDCMQEGMDKGSEICRLTLGYYYWMGFCDITDKEKGEVLMADAKTKYGKERLLIYRFYIQFREGHKEEALACIKELEEGEPEIWNLRALYDIKGILAEQENNIEEATEYYRKALDVHPNPYSFMRLGINGYNRTLNSGDSEVTKTYIYYIEEAFRFGSADAAAALFYCYFESGREWQDNEKGIYWLKKGALYNDAFSMYELASIYLFNETYRNVDLGLQYLESALEKKYVNAFITKAYLSYQGEILPKDMEIVQSLLNEAVELGSSIAPYRLGYLYEQGDMSEDGAPDYKQALAWYELAAERNDATGCEMAGRYHLNGYAGEVNLPKAIEYYERGVSLNSAYCIVELAIMYDDGIGVEQDLPKSFELLKQGEALDYTYAYYLLGRCYKYSVGTDENPDEAIRCFRISADRDEPRAQAELAYCYEIGYGIEEDSAKAFEYMLKAAENNYAYAQYKVGCYYFYGLENLPADYQKALEWLNKASENEYPYAWLELGDYYLYDYGDTGERDKAFDYYRKAAEQDIVNEGLGLCYYNGIGVEENEPEAFKYYLKAAEDNYVRAMYLVGKCYYYGSGIKENPEEAFRWFNDAAGYEHSGAQYYKAKMLLAGEGCIQNIQEGVDLLKIAAEEDEKEAQFELANCYLIGKGLEENEDLAMEWFEKAADNGHEQAQKITGRRKRR